MNSYYFKEMMRDVFSFLLFLVPLVLAAVTLLALIFFSKEYFACENMKRLTGVQTDVSYPLGCMVQHEGRWVHPSVMTRRINEVKIK